jgi:hypothetical protein
VIDAVAELKLAGLYAAYRADGHGRAAHDPAMMLALLLYACAIGERSSRRIERRCEDDVALRVSRNPTWSPEDRAYVAAPVHAWGAKFDLLDRIAASRTRPPPWCQGGSKVPCAGRNGGPFPALERVPGGRRAGRGRVGWRVPHRRPLGPYSF